MSDDSTMFLSNVTCIDHAYIDNEGKLLGGSFNPHFVITGKVDPVENVVVDFSTIKKDIKAIIDGKDSGFDHKLWLIDGFSKYDVQVDPETNNYEIQTPCLELSVPRNAVCFMTGSSHMDPYYMESYITDLLKQKYPIEDLSLYFDMRMDYPALYVNTELHKFRYTHGLKNSTSWGCQNIAHGHMSYIAGLADESNLDEANMVLAKIANYLDERMFVWRENVNRNFVSYETERGKFSIKMGANLEYHKCIYMEKETTIENIVGYIAHKFADMLNAAKIRKIYVSEGLNKGATETYER